MEDATSTVPMLSETRSEPLGSDTRSHRPRSHYWRRHWCCGRGLLCYLGCLLVLFFVALIVSFATLYLLNGKDKVALSSNFTDGDVVPIPTLSPLAPFKIKSPSLCSVISDPPVPLRVI